MTTDYGICITIKTSWQKTENSENKDAGQGVAVEIPQLLIYAYHNEKQLKRLTKRYKQTFLKYKLA